MSASNARRSKRAVLVELSVGLRNDILVLFVSLQILYCIGDVTYYRLLAVFAYDFFMLYLAIRSFDKSVLVDSRIRSKRGYKTDVLSFRSLYRTHTSVMGMVDIADFKRSSFTVETAWSEC